MIAGLGPLQVVGGLLILIRVLAILASSPVFGHAHVPVQVKIGLALMITMVLVPIVAPVNAALTNNLLMLAGAVLKEAATGLIIGFIATLTFLAIQLAGEAADIQIGFGLANIADPLLGTQTSLIGQFQYMMATLLFLVVNGHHFILAALVRSFELVPLNDLTFHAILTGRVLDIVSQLFMMALRIGGPVMLAVFLTDVALGLLGRTVPQMNLLMVGFPVKIFVGLATLMMAVPFFLMMTQGLFATMYGDIITIIRAM
jgi:flagellar biosynthetic protein FliR